MSINLQSKRTEIVEPAAPIDTKVVHETRQRYRMQNCPHSEALPVENKEETQEVIKEVVVETDRLSLEKQEDTVSEKNEGREEAPVVEELLVAENVIAVEVPATEEKVEVIEEKVEVDKIETGPVATTVTSYFEIYLIIASE
jgi:hypothetical protein